MTSTRVPVPGAWPVVADAGHLLVTAPCKDAAGRREPTDGRRLDADAGQPDLRYGLMPPQYGNQAAVWPLFAGLGPLGALPTAPKLIRTFSTLVLGSWGVTAFQDDAELLMSELATNTVAAATGPDRQPRYDDSGRLHLLWARLLSDLKRL